MTAGATADDFFLPAPRRVPQPTGDVQVLRRRSPTHARRARVRAPASDETRVVIEMIEAPRELVRRSSPSTAADVVSSQNPRREDFLRDLGAALRLPFDEEENHAIEPVIERALSEDADATVEWLLDSKRESAEERAILLQCLGRLTYEEPITRLAELAVKGLHDRDLAVRHAAVSAIDNWGARELRPQLQALREQVGWLDEYIQQLLRVWG